MLNKQQQQEFEEMVELGIRDGVWINPNDSIDDLIYPQSDEQEPAYEMVNQPSHYMLCGSETMPMIEKILGTEGYLGFLKGSVLKYRLRASKKKGNSAQQDIEKAMYMENIYDEFIRENTP